MLVSIRFVFVSRHTDVGMISLSLHARRSLAGLGTVTVRSFHEIMFTKSCVLGLVYQHSDFCLLFPSSCNYLPRRTGGNSGQAVAGIVVSSYLVSAV
jgi:hypothetical protein